MKRLALALAVSLLLPAAAQAAVFVFAPASGTATSGQTFTVQIAVSTPSDAVNAVSGEIAFPRETLQVTGISRAGSIVDMWVRDPSFSNENGSIRFEGAILNPGYQGDRGLLMTITFRAIQSGSPQIAFRSGSILANDGMGTNLFTGLTGARFVIGEIPPIPATPTKPSTPPQRELQGTVPMITSETHPNESTWSRSEEARFAWALPDDATGVQYGLDRAKDGQPATGTAGRIAGVTVPLGSFIEDGEYYFHLRFLRGDQTGRVQTRRILVDRLPPETLEISQVGPTDPTEPRRELRVIANDAGSGFDHLRVSWDGGSLRVPGVAASRFLLPALPPGANDLTLVAVDAAGNGRNARVIVHIEPIPSPTLEVISRPDGQASLLEQDRAFVPLVRGYAERADVVVVRFAPAGDAVREVVVPVAPDGSWQLAYAPLALGTWDVSAVARDRRGALSYPMGPIRVSSETFWKTLLELFPWLLVAGLAAVVFAITRRKRRVRELPDEVIITPTQT